MPSGEKNLKNPLPDIIFEERVSVPKWQKSIINILFSIDRQEADAGNEV